MPKNELRAYFEWVLASIPDRVDQLSELVKTDASFSRWEPDHSESSIDMLGEWLLIHLSVRERTEDEMKALMDNTKYPIDMPKNTLTEESYSIAFDVGIYIAKTLMTHHPSLAWIQDFKSRKNVDFGQPLLASFGPVQLNPIRIAVNIAQGLAHKRRPASRLREVYDEWSRRAQ